MSRPIRCMWCDLTFLRLEDFLDHRGTRCRLGQAARQTVRWAVAVAAGCLALAGITELAQAANSNPGGPADWARFAVALAVAIVGGAHGARTIRRPR